MCALRYIPHRQCHMALPDFPTLDLASFGNKCLRAPFFSLSLLPLWLLFMAKRSACNYAFHLPWDGVPLHFRGGPRKSTSSLFIWSFFLSLSLFASRSNYAIISLRQVRLLPSVRIISCVRCVKSNGIYTVLIEKLFKSSGFLAVAVCISIRL